MSRKHFSWLLVITLVVAAAVLLVPGKTGREAGFEKTLLLPDLQPRVNDLDQVRFVGAGDTVIATLRRAEDHWQVEELYAYRADWDRLRALLADLAQAEVVETKTANPEYYDRLGVEDVGAAAASGVRVEFSEASGVPAVIIGKRAEGRDGRYARVQGAAASALIDRNLDLPAAREDWLEKTIVDIADDEVVEIEIRHADGERIVARKASADDENFTLQDVPEGREIASAWTVDSLAGGLSALNLEAVAPDSEIDWSEAARFGLVTADGLRLDAELVERAPAEGGEPAEGQEETGEYWMRLQAGLYQTAVESAVEVAADAETEAEARSETGSGTADEAAEDAEEDAEEEAAEGKAGAPADPAQRAAEINHRVTGWAYRVPTYKYESMTKRMEDLLQAAAEPGG
jgi:hypothetical protein